MKYTATMLCAMLALSSAATAAPVFKITETYVGISGPDGTPDWIEVTNFGDMDGDTGVLYYDDVSADVGDGVQLPSFILSPMESAVFLVTGDAEESSLGEFYAIWGPITNLGYASGGGGLGQGGDTANILLGDNTLVDALTFSAGPASATLEDVTGMGTPTESMVGVNGAYESNPFFNDNIGDPVESMLTLVGSPGRIPEPSSVLLIVGGLIGLASTRARD